MTSTVVQGFQTKSSERLFPNRSLFLFPFVIHAKQPTAKGLLSRKDTVHRVGLCLHGRKPATK